jgi:DHA1 family bicyclomycin/chloramphenicol resistance-like MFS transporter
MTVGPEIAVPSARESISERSLALLLGSLTAFAPLSIDMYLPSLLAIERDLQTTPRSVQLTLSAFFAGLAVAQLAYGPLSDRFGRKRPLVIGLALYVVASLGCALAPHIEALIALRFLQAAGGAAGIVIARAVVRDLRSGAEAARLLSLLMLVMGAAPILAPLVGGWLLLFGTWRLTFGVLTLLGLACLAVVPRALPETATQRLERLDLRTIGRQLRELARDRDFVAYSLAGGFSQAGMFAYIAGSPFVLIGIFHVSPQAYGWMFGANAAGLITASQLNRRLLVGSTPARVLARATVVAVVAGGCLLALALAGIHVLPAVLASLFFFVATLGFVGPNATAVALDRHRERAGLASAVLGSSQFVIAAIASAVVGAANDGTMLPMAAVMASCAVLGLAAATVGRRAPGPDAMV